MWAKVLTEERLPWQPNRKRGNLARGNQVLQTTLQSASVNAPPSCTSSAEGLTGSPWTTGFKQKQRFSEGKNHRRPRRQSGRSSVSRARKRDTNFCIPLLLWWSQSSVVYVTASVVIPKQTAGIMSTVRVLLWSQSAITRPAPLRFAISKTEDSVA